MPAFLDFARATASRDALERIRARTAAPCLFTAHSLPDGRDRRRSRTSSELRDDRGPAASRVRLAAAARAASRRWLPGVEAFGSRERRAAVAAGLSEPRAARRASGSGPDLDDVIDAAAEAGFEAVVFAPIGFATDHMETLYDLDVEARRRDPGWRLDLGIDVPNDGACRSSADATDGLELIERARSTRRRTRRCLPAS